MSLRSDVDVAGVRLRARHLPELVIRLRRAGEPYVASQGATSARREDDSRHLRAVRARGDRSCARRQTTASSPSSTQCSSANSNSDPSSLMITPLETSGAKSSPDGTRCALPTAPRERRGRRLTACSTGTAERHRDERHIARDPPAVAGANEVEAATAELPADRRRQRRQAHMGDTDRQMGGEPSTDSAPRHPGVRDPGEVLDNRQGLMASQLVRRARAVHGARDLICSTRLAEL